MTYESCLDLLISRRSVRKYRPEPVPRDLIIKVLDVARWAPSAKNLQPWEFIVIDDRDVLKKLSEISPSTRPIGNASVAIAVIVDPSKEPLTHQIDGACVTMYILLAAHALGLGAVWVNALRYKDEVRGILGVPTDKLPLSIVAIGWPAESPTPKPRKSLNEVTYVNYYGNRLSV